MGMPDTTRVLVLQNRCHIFEERGQNEQELGREKQGVTGTGKPGFINDTDKTPRR